MTYAFGVGYNYTSAASPSLTVVLPPPRLDLPERQGNGPVSWSTSAELDLVGRHIHDANWYYRALGFSWPFRDITRSMLRKAYQEKVGPGQNEGNVEFLTYALSQLLNKEQRRYYDRLPFGQQLTDKYILERMLAKVREEALRRRAASGQEVSLDEVSRDWGLIDDDDPPVADGDEPLSDSERNPSAQTEEGGTVSQPWPWGFVTWRSACKDVDRLETWQHLLLDAARGLGLRVQLGVGFFGRSPQAWIIGQFRGCLVIFLHERAEPTAELAAAAVAAAMNLNVPRTKPHTRSLPAHA